MKKINYPLLENVSLAGLFIFIIFAAISAKFFPEEFDICAGIAIAFLALFVAARLSRSKKS